MSRKVDLTIADDELVGNVHIARPQGPDEEYIAIELTDEISGTRFCEVRISLVGFTKALTGQGYVPVVFTLRPDLVGMKAEHKVESVPAVGDGIYTESGREQLRKVVATYEIDGWIAHESDITNGHRSFKTKEGNFQSVSFFRHVDPKTGNPILR